MHLLGAEVAAGAALAKQIQYTLALGVILRPSWCGPCCREGSMAAEAEVNAIGVGSALLNSTY